MSVEAIAPVATREEAKHRVALIRNALQFAVDVLHEAFACSDWRALEHPSWEAYCEAELPELRMLRLSKDAQTEQFAALQQKGLSTHAIAQAYGVSQGTVRNRLAGIEKPRTTMSRDGRRRPTTVERPPLETPAPLPVYWQAVHAIAKCGPGGGTTIEVMKRLRWEQGPASAALSRAVKKGLLTATGERRHASGASIGHMVYVVAE